MRGLRTPVPDPLIPGTPLTCRTRLPLLCHSGVPGNRTRKHLAGTNRAPDFGPSSAPDNPVRRLSRSALGVSGITGERTRVAGRHSAPKGDLAYAVEVEEVMLGLSNAWRG